VAVDTPPEPVAERTPEPARARPEPVAPASSVDANAPHDAALSALTWIRAETLPEARRQAFAAVFKNVPRPPRLLQQLISSEFVNNASLEQLTDLISSEPLVAAKVLATANSSMYGLSRPVTGLGQAVSYLGLITMRSLCLQYMLIKSFQADSPERQTLLTDTWNASSLASELTLKLAQAMVRPDPGRLVTLVVLSFLGRLATSATMPRGLLGVIPVGSFLQRTEQEQTKLGLSSSEIGGLLMRDWDLPVSLIDEVREIDPGLVLPDQSLDLALCYLCARLGEQLASGALQRLDEFDLARCDDVDFRQLRRRLGEPAWQAMARCLDEPALSGSMTDMATALRSGAAGQA